MTALLLAIGSLVIGAVFIGLVVEVWIAWTIRISIAAAAAKLASQRTEICPQCGDPVIHPRDSEDYCENCGWPDENRTEEPREDEA